MCDRYPKGSFVIFKREIFNLFVYVKYFTTTNWCVFVSYDVGMRGKHGARATLFGLSEPPEPSLSSLSFGKRSWRDVGTALCEQLGNVGRHGSLRRFVSISRRRRDRYLVRLIYRHLSSRGTEIYKVQNCKVSLFYYAFFTSGGCLFA